jgi:hypothetical protein
LDLSRADRVAPLRISHGSGYHNQPMFSADGRSVLFTAEQPGGQTDIWRYEIAGQSLHSVFASPESEFSPTPIAGEDALSVVRVEPPDQRQRLWRIRPDGGAAELLLPDVERIGYHAWLDPNHVVLFILGDTFDLHLARIDAGNSRKLVANIGRTLRRHPQNGHALFVDKSAEPWAIADFDVATSEVRNVLGLFPGIEDFEVDSSGRYWMGSGSKLYRSSPENDSWQLFVDLGEWGIGGITRLAVNWDHQLIGFVGNKQGIQN